MDDQGGWLFALITVVFVIVLGAAIAYGTMRANRRPRSPELDRARDRVTEQRYRENDHDAR